MDRFYLLYYEFSCSIADPKLSEMCLWISFQFCIVKYCVQQWFMNFISIYYCELLQIPICRSCVLLWFDFFLFFYCELLCSTLVYEFFLSSIVNYCVLLWFNFFFYCELLCSTVVYEFFLSSIVNYCVLLWFMNFFSILYFELLCSTVV